VKVKFIGYEKEYDICEPRFTVGKTYEVVVDKSNQEFDPYVKVYCDFGRISSMVVTVLVLKTGTVSSIGVNSSDNRK